MDSVADEYLQTYLRLTVLQATHPSFTSSGNLNQSWDRRLESLRNQLTTQNRRATGPFSHPLARLGPLQKLREHIRDLSRLADAAILNAESSSPERMQTLTNDLKALLQTQQSWTDRLENQIWRLESQAKWQSQLLRLVKQENLTACDLGDFCTSLAGEASSLPSGILLLPEPGLSFAPIRSFTGWSKSLSWTVEMARISVFTASSLCPEIGGGQLVSNALLASIESNDYPAGGPSESGAFREAIRICSESSAAPDRQVPGLMRIVRRFMSLIEDVSVSTRDRLIPPELIDLYSRSCRQLYSLSEASESEMGRVSAGQDVAIIDAFMKRIGLTIPESMSSSVGESTILTHRLRWHDAESLQPGDGPVYDSRPRGRTPFSTPAPRPRLALICDEDPEESAETAELIVN